MIQRVSTQYCKNIILCRRFGNMPLQGQKDFAIILAKIRDTAIFNRLYIKLYIKFVANNGKNRDFLLSLCLCHGQDVLITYIAAKLQC